MRSVSFSGLLAASLASALVACGGTTSNTAPNPTTPTTPTTPVDTTPPTVSREMRGVWVATVANIDWPSRTTLTADQQRAELITILDRAVASKFNAVIFHVRPAADAVYASAIEPWGSMLTGTQGQNPGYDPLAFAVQEAHARGLELHAWINPFRAGNTADTAKLAANHLFKTNRPLTRIYGTQLWLDPGEPGVQDHSMRVVADIVRRYDIDAIHADDYFYPYRQNDATGKEIDFPDADSYARSGSTLSKDDWRRNNVDRFIERMYAEVHAIKPMVKVGISPFGIWRPGNPAGVTGLDAYQSIFADSKKWLQQGWVDYFVPQLYWSITSTGQSYPSLLDWWLAQNTKGRHMWPGLAAYRVGDGTSSAFSTTEIPAQVSLTRTRPGGTGHVLYNGKSTLLAASPVSASLSTLYAQPALIPAYPWLDSTAPATPTATVVTSALQMTPAAGEAPRWWVVRLRGSSGWSTRILFGTERSLPLAGDIDRAILNAVDAAGNMSASATWAR